MTEMPRIISADDHVVEPPHLWQDRLPEKYRDVGPRVVIAPQGEMQLVDGAWVETPGTGDKMAAWWHYEDHRYQVKEMIACAGMAPEDVTMQGVTFDDIRPGSIHVYNATYRNHLGQEGLGSVHLDHSWNEHWIGRLIPCRDLPLYFDGDQKRPRP